MNLRLLPAPLLLAASAWLAALGCQRMPPDRPAGKQLPPAYASRHFNDPDLGNLAGEIETEALHQSAANGLALFSRVEVLPPVPIVQPYGVGVFQQEVRLPVILTIGPGWSTLPSEQKEMRVAKVFKDFSDRLLKLNREPALRPTLTVQTSQGMALSWINHLDPSGKQKHIHGDD